MFSQHEEMITAAGDLMEVVQGPLTAQSIGQMLDLLDDFQDNLHLMTTAAKALAG